MKIIYDPSDLDWRVAGFTPYGWDLARRKDILTAADAEVPAVPATVPGSVQMALLKAGVIEDWNLGLNSRACEWVENRQWVYQASLPDKWFTPGRQVRLRCLGLDYGGEIWLNGKRSASSPARSRRTSST